MEKTPEDDGELLPTDDPIANGHWACGYAAGYRAALAESEARERAAFAAGRDLDAGFVTAWKFRTFDDYKNQPR